jgi:uncharacterized protein YjdB/alpha-tubulin suppressor-like RCC1 family protein
MKKNYLLLIVIALFLIHPIRIFGISPSAITSCSAGQFFSFSIDSKGRLWSWGANVFGQLGDGTTIARNSPANISEGTRFKAVSTGGWSTIALDSAGYVWTAGSNSSGQLGNSTIAPNSSFIKIMSGRKFKSIASGLDFCFAIDENDDLWAWGNNSYGQLGDGTTEDRLTPFKCKPDTKFKSVAAGYTHSMAIDVSGHLWAWGNNSSGQLGDMTKEQRTTPIMVMSDKKFTSVGCGEVHTIVLDESGWLWSFGSNDKNQLGTNVSYFEEEIPTQIKPGTKFKSISTGYFNSIAIDINNTIWGWGNNEHGELANGKTTPVVLPTIILSGYQFKYFSCGSNHTLAIDEKGNLYSWGSNAFDQLGSGISAKKAVPTKIQTEEKFKDISMGEYHGVGVSNSGNLYIWGNDFWGNIGFTDKHSTDVPEKCQVTKKFKKAKAGLMYTLAIDEENKLWGWGNNGYGQLGLGQINRAFVPQKIPIDFEYLNLYGSNYNSFAFDASGTLWAFGGNSSGELGNGGTTHQYYPIRIQPETKFQTVSPTYKYTFASDSLGNLWVWGDCTYFNGRKYPTPTLLLPKSNFKLLANQGYSHILAIDYNNDLWAWGRNGSGQLGDGTTSNKTNPVRIMQGTKFKSIATGYDCSLAIDESGNLWGWGNYTSQLLGNVDSNVIVPKKLIEGIKFVEVKSSNYSALALDNAGNIWAWGSNTEGQLGDGTSWEVTPMCVIQANVIKVEGILLSQEDIQLKKDSTYQLTATITPEDATVDSVRWQSTNPLVAVVGSNGLIKAVGKGTTTITATTIDGGFTDSCKVTVISPVVGITLSPRNLYISKDSIYRLLAHVLPLDASNNLLQWSSINPEVATVDSTGLITGVSLGDAIIKVTTVEGGFAATCNVSVIVPVTGIHLTPENHILKKDSTYQLIATIQPANATIDSVLWESSDIKIVSITTNGLIKGLKPGNATITANSYYGGFKATCKVTVISPVTGITLPVNLTLKKNSSTKIVASVLPSDATNKSVIWSSSDTTIVSITPSGSIAGIRTGQATVVATTVEGNFKASCLVTVIYPVTGITISKSTLTLREDSTYQLIASVIPSDVINDTVLWSSSNSSIVTVDSTGFIKGIQKGTCTITATSADGNFSAICRVTVFKPVNGISLSDESITLQKNNSYQLIATVQPTDASNTDVLWSSSAPSIVTVDKLGIITGITSGTAIVYVTTVDGNYVKSCIVNVIAPVTGITTTESITIKKNTTSVLTAHISPIDASNKKITWQSSDPSIVTVDSTGLIMGITIGTASVTVTTDDGDFSAICLVNVVYPISGVTLSEQEVILAKDSTHQLIATVHPDNVEFDSVYWITSDSTIVSVDSNGLVKGIRIGTATITVYTVEGNFMSTCEVTVVNPVTGITLPLTISFEKGYTYQIIASILPLDASNDSIIWTSSNTNTVVIDNDGKMEGINIGTSIITATTVDGGFTATCYVTVEISVTGINLSNDTIRIDKNTTWQLNVNLQPVDATNTKVNWSSLDETVAIVSSTGLVFGVSEGTTTILAITDDGDYTAMCVVEVKSNVSSSILSDSGISIYPNPIKDGTLYIHFNKPHLNSSVLIYNSKGQLLIDRNLQEGLSEGITLNNFKSGLYMVRIIGDGINEVRKIIVE